MTPDNEIESLPDFVVSKAVKNALQEDLGRAGDLTTNATIPKSLKAEAEISSRQPGIIAGHQLARTSFHLIDGSAKYQELVSDGQPVKAGQTIAIIEANARALLTGERIALNFMGHLSGIATLTREFVDAVTGTNAKICCTRKTTPGLRVFEKYAVRAGGGTNHRFGLDDAILIKDNHVALAGGIEKAIESVLSRGSHMVKIEVEVDSLDQLDIVLKYPVDAVLLDNMSLTELTKAVERIDGRLVSEASGGITLQTVGNVAKTGVDLISVGALTHSAPSLDIGLDFATTAP
jgi:nicotinate-nucleotide pyrophosphorylase (carboxylating)